jgi:hypothetical protein
MRFVKLLTVLFFALSVIAMAKDNKLGIRDVNHVKFDSAIHIGSEVLPAGEYVVRHTMQGEEHIMVFRNEQTKGEFKVKCTLVPLTQKAEQSQTVYTVNADKQRVLQEMVFRGDTAKHVF